MSDQSLRYDPEAIYPRVREDLEWVEYADSKRWVVIDDIRSAYYYFSALEYQCCRLMSGGRSIREIVDYIHHRTVYKSISSDWVFEFVRRLQQSQLMVRGTNQISKVEAGRSSDTLPANARFSARIFKRSPSWLSQTIANPFCIRLPILTPRRPSLVSQILSRMLWCRASYALCLSILSVVFFLVVGRLIAEPELSFRELSRIQGDRWLILGVVFLIIKSLHEYGHYLACVKQKVRCKEIGVLFLFFAPSLYCDTTDSWRLPSKWGRAAVAAGGIYVELWLASLAGIAFLVAESEWMRTLAAEALIVCTISTVIVNGNPFFRYDGYYIASDLMGVPNLAKQSQSAMWDIFVALLGGRPADASRYDRPLWQLALFGAISSVYRATILIAIISILWQWFIPMGLGIVAFVLLAMLGVSILLQWKRFGYYMFLEFFAVPPVRFVRVAIFLSFLIAVCWAAIALPLPVAVRSRGYLDWRDRRPVFCRETASLREVGRFGVPLASGDLLFETESVPKRLEVLKLENELKTIAVRLEVLNGSMVDDQIAAFEVPTLRELQRERQARLQLLQAESSRMTERAPAAGTFYPVLTKLPRTLADGQESFLFGYALDPSRLASQIDRGTQLGWFVPQADPLESPSFIVRAAVSERDMRWLRLGMSVQIQCDAVPNRKYRGTIDRIEPDPLDECPTELWGDYGLILLRDQRGQMAFEEPHYLVVVNILDALPKLQRGSLASAEFEIANRTCVEMMLEKIRVLFQAK